jgi:hypothetical protein
MQGLYEPKKAVIEIPLIKNYMKAKNHCPA